MQKLFKSLNVCSIVLCFVSLFVLDIHVFGENAMETKILETCMFFLKSSHGCVF